MRAVVGALQRQSGKICAPGTRGTSAPAMRALWSGAVALDAFGKLFFWRFSFRFQNEKLVERILGDLEATQRALGLFKG
ncbi:hypothetical protein L484_018583 [Morus notabilis]|uniref:Uncharacterized protein n=1 Tax=Morus notabilis TaxID=981085 RepID=W9RVN6_9ROSA|nr:hypothetical protein L484_018583 [Morus notabilis]